MSSFKEKLQEQEGIFPVEEQHFIMERELDDSRVRNTLHDTTNNSGSMETIVLMVHNPIRADNTIMVVVPNQDLVYYIPFNLSDTADDVIEKIEAVIFNFELMDKDKKNIAITSKGRPLIGSYKMSDYNISVTDVLVVAMDDQWVSIKTPQTSMAHPWIPKDETMNIPMEFFTYGNFGAL